MPSKQGVRRRRRRHDCGGDYGVVAGLALGGCRSHDWAVGTSATGTAVGHLTSLLHSRPLTHRFSLLGLVWAGIYNPPPPTHTHTHTHAPAGLAAALLPPLLPSAGAGEGGARARVATRRAATSEVSTCCDAPHSLLITTSSVRARAFFSCSSLPSSSSSSSRAGSTSLQCSSPACIGSGTQDLTSLPLSFPTCPLPSRSGGAAAPRLQPPPAPPLRHRLAGRPHDGVGVPAAGHRQRRGRPAGHKLGCAGV